MIPDPRPLVQRLEALKAELLAEWPQIETIEQLAFKKGQFSMLADVLALVVAEPQKRQASNTSDYCEAHKQYQIAPFDCPACHIEGANEHIAHLEAELAAEPREEIARLTANLQQLIKAEEAYRESERAALRRLSDALTDGNAGTWDEIFHAAESLATPAPPRASAREDDRAERIAREAHAEQKDTVTGGPYIAHVERVVAGVIGEQAKAVAWLHDVIEDTDYSLAELRRASISTAVLDAVDLLTKPDNSTAMVVTTYAQYIERIRASGNELAIAVKLADLRDHLRPNCPERLRPRYEAALTALTVATPARAPEPPK